ncbi:MAG TPA: DPP IV N-terminal domain-containing protein [Pyrinomonadaceae bacterium]|jgi:dipeptidyl aminopeptidase/acylaminoacyl peptidase
MKVFFQLKSAILLLAFVSSIAPAFAQEPTAITAADYARAEKFMGYNTAPLVSGAVRATWVSGDRFWYRKGSEFVLVNAADGARQTFPDQARLNAAIADAPKIVIQNGVPNSVLSPDGNRAAYIKDYNLWVRDLVTRKDTQLTKDGVKDYGYATDNAGWTQSDRAILAWSPDSKKIATFQQDQRKTSDMYLVETTVGKPKLKAWKYPLPGDADVTMIERVIIDVDSARVIRLKMPPDQHRTTLCDDISCNGGDFTDTEWSADSLSLAFVSSSRDHKKANLRVVNPATGEIREVLEEVSPTQYESGWSTVNWRYLPASNEVIWFSEKSGWGHLYLHDLATGRLKNQITTGDFVVREILKIDDKTRTIYFSAGGREAGRNPYFAHFYRVGFDGKNLQLLTPEDGHHSISLSPSGRFFIDTYSKPDTAPVSVLRDMTGKTVAEIEKVDISRLTATGWKPPQLFTVKAGDGQTDVYGLMYTPSNLDANRKYPIVNYIYPGPQGGSIGGNWGFSPARQDNQALAELGFVVVQIEGTCNPLRSKKFHDACYGNMADNTLADQIAGMRQLAQRFPYIDLNRVGIWGHSGGGFATAAAMFRHPDFFKVGIAESGNHDNRNYEDDWGERYIGLETKVNGKSNYEEQANQVHAKNLKGKLLLAHGTMDDNVPPYNTYLVVDALIKANKDFDLLMIPNARHGFGSATLYMTRRRWDYFVKHLLGVEPPKEYGLKPPAPTPQ